MRNNKTRPLATVALAVFAVLTAIFTTVYHADATKAEGMVEETPLGTSVCNELPALPVFRTRYIVKTVERPVIVEKEIYIPVAAEPLPYTADDLYCLAAAIYQEAGGNDCTDDCRRMVADVILNRVESDKFPDTIRCVLEQKYQYGLFWKTGVTMPNRGDNEIETKAITRAWYIAADVLNGNHSKLYGNGYIWQAEFEQGTGNIECCGIFFGKDG